MTKKTYKKQENPIKKAHEIESFTEEQIQELSKCSKDFMYFVRTYCYISHPLHGKVQFVPYDYQIKMLEAFLEHNNLVYMCGRQLGKSTCAALYILWKAIFFEDQTVLIVSNNSAAAIEILDRIKYAYEFLPSYLKPGVIINNVKNIVFDNRSEVITRATTKSAGRGLSISLLYCLSGNTTVKVRDKKTLAEKDRNLESLYNELHNDSSVSLNNKYEILTPDGWKNFKGIQYKGEKLTFRISLANGKTIDATEDHYFFNENGKIQLSELSIGDKIQTIDGIVLINDIEELYVEDVYDIVEVDQIEHKFIVNNCIISKNCDELSSVEPMAKQKDFWTAVRPTLSTGGQCIITSTPISDEDQFAQIWQASNDIYDSYGNENPKGVGKNGFKAIKYIWSAHPNRDEQWAETERAAIGENRFEREHNCSFISDSDTLIDGIKLATLKGKDPKYLTGQTRWYQKPEEGKTYMVALDPSMGNGGDYASIQVFQLPEMIQVAEWQHNKTDARGQTKTLRDILKYIQSCISDSEYDDLPLYWTVENNGGYGENINLVIKETGQDSFPGTYLSEPIKSKTHGVKSRKGFNTNNRNKLEACSKFKSLVERDKIVINSKPLISELKVFVSKGASYGAKSQEHDDLVSSCLLIVRMLATVMKYSEEFEEILSERLDDDDYDMPLSILVTTTNPYNY